jgi:putative effector of murein hydrolase LrgA (UPF0299 family)
VTNAFVVETPTPRRSKAVLSALVRWLLRVGVGIAVLDLYLRLVAFLMAAAGIAVAPLVAALIGLTATLLAVPPKGTLDRAITRTLKPAVDAVDAQIACIFIPYIAAVPVSHLPSGSLLWTAAAACTVGTIATMFVAGKVAQAFSNPLPSATPRGTGNNRPRKRRRARFRRLKKVARDA